jgi:hypothetical protein
MNSVEFVDDDQDKEYEYSLFSLEPLDEIETISIYVNKDNHVQQIKQETLAMENSNKLSRLELDNFIQKNIAETKNTYRITSLCLFKIDINSDQVIDYINQSDDENTYLQNIKQFSKIEDIKFNDSLIMFHDINSLIFVFSEITIPKMVRKGKLKRNKTKKILEQFAPHHNKSKRIL